ncbi:MAG: glycosyltransferase [Gammaproteobacteria bacterium]|nr:MAG: glycosyltransferase [Gammaproteobacteria bacterium]
MSVYYQEEPRFLDESLQSIFDQTLPPTEVILIEDGPLTNELDKVVDSWCEKEKSLKVVKLDQNKGLGEALRIGMGYCSHAIIARMDSDDISCKDRFEKQIKFLQDNPEIDVVGSDIAEFNNDPAETIAVRRMPCEHGQISATAKVRCPMNHVSVMFRKEQAISAGSYVLITAGEDYYLWVRMIQAGAKFANIPESLVHVRVGSGMLGRRVGFKYLKGEIKLHTIFFKTGFLTLFEYLRNIMIRAVMRFLPGKLMSNFYSFLRNDRIQGFLADR